MKIAVCIATYNGEKFIKQQVESILCEIGESDTIFISDDCSTDDTIVEISKIIDRRIVLIKNSINLGYAKNFESVVSKVTDADFIFFSDQDDSWVPGRVSKMIGHLKETGKNILFGDLQLMNSIKDNGYFNKEKLNSISNGLLNLCRLFIGAPQFPYYGSAMVITAKAKSYIFPIPLSGVGHDIWVALLGNIKKDIAHLDEIVTLRRIHDANITNRNRSIIKKIKTRIIWIIALAKYYIFK